MRVCDVRCKTKVGIKKGKECINSDMRTAAKCHRSAGTLAKNTFPVELEYTACKARSCVCQIMQYPHKVIRAFFQKHLGPHSRLAAS